jgi:RNA polymerase sigma-70 factor (ECF subfamily)
MESMDSASDIRNFNNLFNEYYSRFVRFAMGYLKDQPVAEDFVSEAFTLYWENRENLLPNTNAPAYILTIVKNKCINHLHHEQIRLNAEKEMTEHAEWVLNTRISTLEACDPEDLFSDEMREIVRKTLDKLPLKTRRIFILNRYHGFSYKDIAKKMSLSPKTVEYHISKALSCLRLSLRDFIFLSAVLFLLF